MPTEIVQGDKFSRIVYSPEQDRIKQIDSNGRETLYIGGVYEEVKKGGVTRKLHYVGDFAILTQTESLTPTLDYEYLHKDHLGSTIAVSKSTVNSASDVTYQSNGVWGERRYQQWNGPEDIDYSPTTTAKGFTDHEHLDAVGLIHMNGRVYDPELGRFMSADPYIQAPYNSQSYNRYSYVFNNPLSLVDPSGFTSQPIEEVYVTGRRDQGCGTADYCITGTQAGHFADAYRNHMDRANNYFVDYSGGYLDAAAYVGLAVVDELVFSDFVIAIDAAIQSDYKTFASSMVFAVAKPVKGVKIAAEAASDALSTTKKKVKWGAQEKHFPGHNAYDGQRSTVTANPEKLIERAGTGEPANNFPRGEAGFRERIVYDEIIGTYTDGKGSIHVPSNVGILHYSKDAIHVVPGRPQ